MATEKRLIDANALIERFDELAYKYKPEGDLFFIDGIVDEIMDAPEVDAVEVVRCKDCKHCSQNTPDGLHWCDEHEVGSLMDDDFCSYGERRKGK